MHELSFIALLLRGDFPGNLCDMLRKLRCENEGVLYHGK